MMRRLLVFGLILTMLPGCQESGDRVLGGKFLRQIECPECGFRFPLNLRKELDGTERDRQPVVGCTCPNCLMHIDASNSNEFQMTVPPQQP